MNRTVRVVCGSPGWRAACLLALSVLPAGAQATAADINSPPIPVTFGTRALMPDTPVNPQVAFVSQSVRLPAVVCGACTADDTWTRTWTLSQVHPDQDNMRPAQGWYVFHSGVRGIDISVQTATAERREAQGRGARLPDAGELTVGLVRTAWDTGAGLADLPPAEFRRTTVFTGPDGQVKYTQEDTLRVMADLRVPTCTTTAGSLHFQLADISQGVLRQTVVPGGHTETAASVPQTIVANCSENTQRLRIRFMPSGAVTDSQSGPATILAGRDDSGQETGAGFLLTYDAGGFGRTQQGVVSWRTPLVLDNPQPVADSSALSQGITVTLQAFYARPENGRAVTAGHITAKGLYQISYE